MSRPFLAFVALISAGLAGAGTGWLSVAAFCLNDPKFSDGCSEAWLPSLSFSILSVLICAGTLPWVLRLALPAARVKSLVAAIGAIQASLLVCAFLKLPAIGFWIIAGLAASGAVILAAPREVEGT